MFKTLYVSPSREQTQQFSTLKVGKIIQYSPIVRQFFADSRQENRVGLRMFNNGSELAFRYAKGDDADRCRGYTGDRMCLDEIQDMVLELLEPVVRECLSASPYKWLTRCGTPKTMDNGIQAYWERSSQTEWVVKCEGCGQYNGFRSERQIGKWGPICLKCGKYLQVRNGQWVDMNPVSIPKNADLDDPENFLKNKVIKGFHISRLMMPCDTPSSWPENTPQYALAKKNWLEILDKYQGPQAYPLSKFRNEVLGVSDSQGRRLITRSLLHECCTGPELSVAATNYNMADITDVAAGIDWSGGGTETLSRTVVWIIGRKKNGGYRSLYYKIFPGANPVDEVEEIEMIIKKYSMCKLIGCDAGEGNMSTEMLRKKFGPSKVFKVRYGAPKYHIRWDPEGKFYSVNKTWSIDSLMTSLQRKEFEFSKNTSSMDPAFTDMLAEFEHVTGQGYKIWKHSPNAPDDCLHALNFARLAIQILRQEVDLTSKGKEPDKEQDADY
jgi:hypothetical protein